MTSLYDTYLGLLLVEVINNNTNEKVEGEEGAEDDEDDEVDIHVEVGFICWLLLNLFKEPMTQLNSYKYL